MANIVTLAKCAQISRKFSARIDDGLHGFVRTKNGKNNS